ncbi:hypothetical protein BX600DRAFT_468042 [Xylariales sp. PMI_506]|nr:hypothetical protein BX600DRAFT_468042 [Xylariales sp. PMI_506]
MFRGKKEEDDGNNNAEKKTSTKEGTADKSSAQVLTSEPDPPAKAGNKSLFQRIKGKADEKKQERRRVLCASPIFRLASTSSDPSVFRGASITSMPIELTVKVASMVGKAHVSTLAAPITNITSQLQPGAVTETIAQTAYDMSGLEDKVDERIAAEYEAAEQERSATRGRAATVGADTGPEAPFPLKFSGKIAPGTSGATPDAAIPGMIKLSNVQDHICVQLRGLHFGWVSVPPAKSDESEENEASNHAAASLSWYAALISVGPDPDAGPSVAIKPIVRFHVLHPDAGEIPSCFSIEGAKVKIITMGFLHASTIWPPADPEKAQKALERDGGTVRASLGREAWGAAAVLESLAAAKSGRSLTQKYVDARKLIKHRTDSLSLHQLSIRGDNAELIDRLHGTGGLWVAR